MSAWRCRPAATRRWRPPPAAARVGREQGAGSRRTATHNHATIAYRIDHRRRAKQQQQCMMMMLLLVACWCVVVAVARFLLAAGRRPRRGAFLPGRVRGSSAWLERARASPQAGLATELLLYSSPPRLRPLQSSGGLPPAAVSPASEPSIVRLLLLLLPLLLLRLREEVPHGPQQRYQRPQNLSPTVRALQPQDGHGDHH